MGSMRDGMEEMEDGRLSMWEIVRRAGGPVPRAMALRRHGVRASAPKFHLAAMEPTSK